MRLRISLFVVAALLLGAHFLRAGSLALVALCLAAPLLFFWRQRWSLILLQLLAIALPDQRRSFRATLLAGAAIALATPFAWNAGSGAPSASRSAWPPPGPV